MQGRYTDFLAMQESLSLRQVGMGLLVKAAPKPTRTHRVRVQPPRRRCSHEHILHGIGRSILSIRLPWGQEYILSEYVSRYERRAQVCVTRKIGEEYEVGGRIGIPDH